jgi:hypothetical protein
VWPTGDSAREAMLVAELTDLLQVMQIDLFVLVYRQFFSRLASCIRSGHYIVCECPTL